MKWEAFHINTSTNEKPCLMKDLFEDLFPYEEQVKEELKREIGFYFEQQELFADICKMRQDEPMHSKDVVKQARRDIEKLERVLNNPTPSQIKKAIQIHLKHFGKYDKFEITETTNYIIQIRDHKTLVFNSASKDRRYTKTSNRKPIAVKDEGGNIIGYRTTEQMSLSSQLKSVLADYGIVDNEAIKDFIKEL